MTAARPTRWLAFWCDFYLPVPSVLFLLIIGLVAATGKLGTSADGNQSFFIVAGILTVLAVFRIAVGYGLARRQRWALFSVYMILALETLWALVPDDPLGPIAPQVPVFFAVVVLWFMPNAVYFWKRRDLFGPLAVRVEESINDQEAH